MFKTVFAATAALVITAIPAQARSRRRAPMADALSALWASESQWNCEIAVSPQFKNRPGLRSPANELYSIT